MKLDFKKQTIADGERLWKILNNNSYRGCEFSVANLILWSGFYHTEYAVTGDVLVTKQTSEDSAVRLSFPIGAGDDKEELQIFECELEYFRTIGQAPRFGMIDHVMMEKIERWYPDRFQWDTERNWADYVYSREQLASLAGKKLHGKRNHIKRFIDRHPEWKYETITEDNVEECICMAKEWCRQHCVQEDDEKEEEAHLVNRALRSFRTLHMKGGLLRIKEGVIAFTLGCPITKDTFDVNFEKAFGDIQGAYPMINQQFVLHELQDYTYINREEDLGIEGLRKAKLSYAPVFLLEKGIVFEKN